MANATATFKEPFLGRVKTALQGATSISWDGCHKIYIAADQDSHEQQVDFGYNTVTVNDPDDAVATLYDWWEDSCGLRFINRIENGSVFGDVIPQFEYDDEQGEE